ncbi:MAG: hypothetical protein J5J00_10235 [Deltaproteobacteria bacterium]|nr:hypothetical protein [Deltaproteobacteria bacterium]
MESFAGYINAFLAVLLLTCFVKVLLSLSILRIGLGLNTAGIGLVFVALSLALSYLVMQPQLTQLGGLQSMLSPSAEKSSEVQEKLKPFLERHSDAELRSRLQGMQSRLQESASAARTDDMPVLVTSFLLTELKEGLELGILILIPFLVIDLLVSNVLVLLGVTSLSPEVISLPCKLLLFFAIDGWSMIAQKLINGYI